MDTPIIKEITERISVKLEKFNSKDYQEYPINFQNHNDSEYTAIQIDTKYGIKNVLIKK